MGGVREKRNNSVHTKVSDGGGEVLQAEIPVQPMEKPSAALCRLYYIRAHIHTTAYGGPHLIAGRYDLKLQTMERHTEADRWWGPMGNLCQTSLYLKDWTLWCRLMLEQFLKNCSQWREPMNAVHEWLFCGRTYTPEHRKSVRKQRQQRWNAVNWT